MSEELDRLQNNITFLRNKLKETTNPKKIQIYKQEIFNQQRLILMIQLQKENKW